MHPAFVHYRSECITWCIRFIDKTRPAFVLRAARSLQNFSSAIPSLQVDRVRSFRLSNVKGPQNFSRVLEDRPGGELSEEIGLRAAQAELAESRVMREILEFSQGRGVRLLATMHEIADGNGQFQLPEVRRSEVNDGQRHPAA